MALGPLHRTVKAVAVSIILLSQKECAELFATPLIDAELAGLPATAGQFAMQGIEVIDREGHGARFVRLVVELDDQPDLNSIPLYSGGSGVAAQEAEAHHRFVVRDRRPQLPDRERARVLIGDW